MATTDRRMGSARRGMTVLGRIPAAPKPINLPSQRLENQGLVPDVEIVPRGTFSWGSGRSPAAGCNESGKMGVVSSPPVSSGAWEDNGAKIESKFVTSNEVGGFDEKPIRSLSAESSTSPPSSACGNKSAGSDAGALAENLTRSSSAGSGTSPSSAPVIASQQAWDTAAKLEKQGQSSGFASSPAYSRTQGSEKFSNLPPEQSGDGYSRAGPEPQGFGYFGDVYSSYPAFCRSGVPLTGTQGMAFGPGMYPDSSQHDRFYSSPGVPYYSNMKDREIVVITMVGNPGFYGSYLPHSGFPEHYGRPGMYGNFPLQFGHFEHFVVPGHGMLDCEPQVPADMSSAFLGEQGEFVCHGQEGFKDSWVHGSSKDYLGGLERDVHEVQMPTSVLASKTRPNQQKYRMSKKTGRQRSAYRNGRVVSTEASSAVSVPEKRITLLTKASRHEVIINSFQVESQDGGGGCEVGPFGSPSSVQIMKSVPENECECETETAPIEISNAGKVVEDLDTERSDAAGVSKSLKSARESFFPQATGMEAEREVSIPPISCDEVDLPSKVETATFEASPTLVFQEAQGKTVVHESTPSALPSCPRVIEKVPVSFNKKLNGVIRPKGKVRQVILDADSHDTNDMKGQEDASLTSLNESAGAIDQVINVETLKSTTTENPPCQNNQEVKPTPPNQKSSRKWMHKWSAAEAKLLGHKVFVPKIQKALKDINLSQNSPSECSCEALSVQSAICNIRNVSSKLGADMSMLPTHTAASKSKSEGSTSSLSLSASGAVSAGVSSAISNEKLYSAIPLGSTAPDGNSENKKSKKLPKDASHSGCHDIVAAVVMVKSQKSLKKTAIEDRPFMKDHKQKTKGAYYSREKEWRPKPPAAIHAKSATKVSGLQVTKAHVAPEVSELQVIKSHVAPSSTTLTDSKNSSEVSYDDEIKKKFKQKGNSYRHPQRDGPSFAMDKLQTGGSMPLTPATGAESNKTTARGENAKELQNNATVSPRNKSVENKGHNLRPIVIPKLQQQQFVASKHKQQKQMHRGDIPKTEGQTSPVRGVESHQSSRPVDAKSRIECKISEGVKPSHSYSCSSPDFQLVRALQFEEGCKEHEDASHVGHSLSASQFCNPQELNNNRNQSFNSASVLLQQPSARNYQRQKYLYARERPERQAAPGHSLEKDQPAGPPATSPDTNFGTERTKQGCFYASWGQNNVRERYLPVAASRYQLSGRRGNRLKERFLGHDHAPPSPQLDKFENHESYSISRLQQQKQLHVMDISHSSASEQGEGSCTVSDATSGTENRLCRNFTQGALHVSWRQKKLREGQVPKEASVINMKESEKNHLTPAAQMKKASEDCQVVASSSSVPSSPQYGNGQPVSNMIKQSYKAVLEKQQSAVTSYQGQRQQQTRKASLSEDQAGLSPSQQPTGSLSSLSRFEDNTQSAVTTYQGQRQQQTRKASPLEVQAGLGPSQQPTGLLSSFPRSEENTSCKTVKPGRYYTSWRLKVVRRNVAPKEAFIKEVNENDPSPSTNVEGSSKKHTHLPPSSQAAAMSDLHVWKNNGRHSVRASYGLPLQQKDHPWPQKGFTLSLGQHVKPHLDCVSTSEHKDRANEKAHDQDLLTETGSLVSMKEKKHGSPWKQAKPTSPLETTGPPVKSSKQQVHVAKQVEPGYNQQSTPSNRRPFSTKSNFAHDDSEKSNHYYQPLSQTFKPMEQGRPRGDLGIKEINHMEIHCASRCDNKPSRRGRFYGSGRAADFDRRGWSAKKETSY